MTGRITYCFFVEYEAAKNVPRAGGIFCYSHQSQRLFVSNNECSGRFLDSYCESQ